MMPLCLAVFAAGGLVLPPPSTEKPPEGGTLAYLGFDRVCHQRMPAFAKLFKCPAREPAIDAALSALDGESLAAVGAAAVEKALRAALDEKQQGEIDLVFIDTKQRVYWVAAPGAARGPNFELKDKAHTFLLLLANVLRKLQLDAPLLVRISRHTPNEKREVVQDVQRDGLGALLHATLAHSTLLVEKGEGSATRLPLLEMHIRAKDLQHGFGIPSVLLSWMATALYPWPRRLRRLIAEADVRERGSAAAKHQLKQRARRRRARRKKEAGGAEGATPQHRLQAEASGARLVPWKRRTAKVVWRGGTTGMRSFLRLPKAMRLEALRATSRARLMSAVDDVAERTMGARALSSIFDIGYHKVHEELHAMVDTDNSDRSSRVDGELGEFVHWLDAHKRPFVSTVEQGGYKYQLSVDGLAAPWRLSLQLVLGGAILKQEGSLFHEMYQPRLEAGTHYLPLNRSLADLAHVAAWAVENDASAARVANAAKEFARTWLSAEALACYVARLLVTLSEKQALPEGWRPPERTAHLTLVFDPDLAAEEPRHHSLVKRHARGGARSVESKQCRAAKRDGTLREAKRDAATAVLNGFVEGKPKLNLAATLVAPAKLCEQHCHGFVAQGACFQMCRRDNCRGMCKGLGAL
jgi:hypothetical protein